MVLGNRLYSSVQPGFEAALEAEILSSFPGARVVESLPGWRVFELLQEVDAERIREQPSAFARSWGILLGEQLPAAKELGAVVLHCWSRREFLPGAREKRPVLIDVERREAELRQELPALGYELLPREVLSPGVQILNLIRVTPSKWRWGIHLQTESRSRHPGGEYPWPEERVPSRAYLKCREALEWSGVKAEPEQWALELGCSPGGALVAMFEQGWNVVGVDPGALDPQVQVAAAGHDFVHHRIRAERMEESHFPGKVDWLFSDMNAAPEFLLGWVTRWLPLLRQRGMRAAFLTLKLTDRSFMERLATLPATLRQEWDAERVQLRQLSQNRTELQLFVDFVGKG